MHISGKALPVQHQLGDHSSKQDEVPKPDEPKVRFLSTWESSRSGPPSFHRSIHHFCTEPSIEQLPIPLQILSGRTHTKPLETEWEDSLDKTGGDESTDQAGAVHETVRDLPSAKVRPPPNTPHTTTRTTSVAKGQAPVIRQDDGKSAKKVTLLPPGGRPSTVGVKGSAQVNGNDDDIIERAKGHLKKELRSVQRRDKGETKLPSAKLSERRVKQKETQLRTSLENNEEQTILGGSRVKVAQDPSK